MLENGGPANFFHNPEYTCSGSVPWLAMPASRAPSQTQPGPSTLPLGLAPSNHKAILQRQIEEAERLEHEEEKREQEECAEVVVMLNPRRGRGMCQ